MAALERNTFANLFGTLWSVLIGILCVPLFIRYLGAEGFGLTGIFVTLQSIFAFLDLGIGVTLNRELALMDGAGAPPEIRRDTVFTLQAIYCAIALAIGVATFAAAPLIATHWVRPHLLTTETVRASVRLMGVAIALQFPFVLYQCGLLGLQRHVAFNALAVVVATLRGPGTVLALRFVSPAPQTYFAAQVIVSACATPAIAMMLWRALPRGPAVRFRFGIVRRVWRFSAAYSANALANVALLQGDKVILSRMLPLATFGYYTLAQRLVTGVYAVIIAVDGAVFPQLSSAVAGGDDAALARVYHRAAQLMAVLIVPLSLVLTFFSREVILVWTGDVVAAANAHTILTFLAAGMMLHGLMHAPYYLQLAFGSWSLISKTNAVLVVTTLPAYAVMAHFYGAPGGAFVFVLLNLAWVAIVPLVHRRFARGELRRWILDDTLLPVAGVALIAAAAAALLPSGLGRIQLLAWLAAAGALTTLTAAMIAPVTRRMILPSIRREASLQ